MLGVLLVVHGLVGCARPEKPIWPEIREEGRKQAQALTTAVEGVREGQRAGLEEQARVLAEVRAALEREAGSRRALEGEVKGLAGALEASRTALADLEKGLAGLEAGGAERAARLERRLDDVAVRLDQARGEAQAGREAARKAEAAAAGLGEAIARQKEELSLARLSGEEALERFRQLGGRLQALEKEVRALPAVLAPPQVPDVVEQSWEPSAGPGWWAWVLGGLALAGLLGGAFWAWRSRGQVVEEEAETPAPSAPAFERPRATPAGEAPPRRALVELRAREGAEPGRLAQDACRLLAASPLVLVEPGPEVVEDPEGRKVRVFFWTPGFVPDAEVETLRGRVEALAETTR